MAYLTYQNKALILNVLLCSQNGLLTQTTHCARDLDVLIHWEAAEKMKLQADP